MSASSANPATKNAASATPWRRRITTTAASESTNGNSTMPSRGQQRAEHHERQPAVGVGQPARERTADQSRDAERAEREARAGLVGADRPGGVQRQGVDGDADRREVGEVGDAEQHEGAGEETLLVRVPRDVPGHGDDGRPSERRRWLR